MIFFQKNFCPLYMTPWSPPSEVVTDGSILLEIVPSSFHQHERNCNISMRSTPKPHSWRLVSLSFVA